MPVTSEIECLDAARTISRFVVVSNSSVAVDTGMIAALGQSQRASVYALRHDWCSGLTALPAT